MEAISGKTVGIVGYGDIGRAVAARVRPMGMKVLALKRHVVREPDPLIEQTYSPDRRIEMLARCDYVVVAAPLTQETRGMIAEPEFAAMKPSAVVINVGRGPVIQEGALISALSSGRIRGAGLDVFDQEPLPRDHKMRKRRMRHAPGDSGDFAPLHGAGRPCVRLRPRRARPRGSRRAAFAKQMAAAAESRVGDRGARRRHDDAEHDVSAPADRVEGSTDRGAVEAEFCGAGARSIEIEVDEADDGRSVESTAASSQALLMAPQPTSTASTTWLLPAGPSIDAERPNCLSMLFREIGQGGLKTACGNRP